MLPYEERLKEALHTSAFESQKPAKAIAVETGITYEALQKFCSTFDPSHLPSRRFPAFVQAIDNYAILDLLEELAGRIAFTLPQSGGIGKSTGHATKEFGEFLEAVADADMTPETAERVVREGEDVIRAVAAVVEQAKRIVATQQAGQGPRAVSK